MQPGDEIGGCRLERPIGKGAMGVVFLAHRADGTAVAVKFLENVTDPGLRVRFGREGAALARLPRHPTLVRVHSVHPGHEPPCLIMEMIPGETLAERIARGPLDPRDAARIARDVAGGLAVVHAHGLLHRDLKPANLLLTPGGQVRIVDFGLVKDVFATVLTEPGQVLGTAPYMAPECWTGEPTTAPAVDVFALGATLYESLSGAPPFGGRDLEAIRRQIAKAEYPPLGMRALALPPGLEDVVAMMLASEPRHRYRSMRACREDLDRVLHGELPESPRFTGSPWGRRSVALCKRAVIGSDPTCDVSLKHGSVAAQHAQLRRLSDGYQLRDLRSPTGTYRGGERVARSTPLADGDAVRFGEVSLRFVDPRARVEPPPFLASPARVTAPVEEVTALAGLGDPRATELLLEFLVPDPTLPAEALQRVPQLADAERSSLTDALRGELARLQPWAAARLAQVAGSRQQDVDGWLGWWAQRRPQLPGQWVAAGARRWLSLDATAGEPGWQPHSLGVDDVILIGRDPRCQVRLRNRTVSRVHATLLRLHRRLVVRNQGTSSPATLNGTPITLALFEPGDVLGLGDVLLRLEVEATSDAAVPCHPLVVDLLLARGHPAACDAALKALLPTESADAVGQRLFPSAPRQAAATARLLTKTRARRAQHARLLLSAVLGGSPSDSPDEFRVRLATADLPPQLRA